MRMFRHRPLPGAVLAALCLGGAAPAVPRAQVAGQQFSPGEKMNVREDLRETVELAPGAQVRVRSIGGPVSVETAEGDMAEIRVRREAATQRELDCYRVTIETSRDRIDVRHVQFAERPGCRRITARQEVQLRIPRSADVHLSSIAGRVDVAPREGMVRLNGIAGATTLASVRSADVSGIAGPLLLRFDSRGPWKADISGISGPVDLAFRRGVDADIRVSGLVGSVRSLSPDIRVAHEEHRHLVRVGSGGAPLSVSGVVGAVQVRRY